MKRASKIGLAAAIAVALLAVAAGAFWALQPRVLERYVDPEEEPPADENFALQVAKSGIPSDCPADVRKEVEALYSVDAVARAKALMALEAMGPRAEPAIPQLLGLLGDFRVVQWRRQYWPFQDVESRVMVLQLATDVLVAVGEPSVEPLMAACREDFPSWRAQSALRALVRLKDPRAILLVAAAIESDAPMLAASREEFILSLAGFGEPATDTLLDVFRNREGWDRNHAILALTEIGVPAAERTLARAEGADAEARRADAIALARIVTWDVHPAYRPPEKILAGRRQEIIQSLRTAADPRVPNLFAPLIWDDDADVRKLGVATKKALNLRVPEALGRAAAERLASELRDAKDIVMAAADILVEIGSPAVGPLESVLRDGPESARERAASALGRIGDPAAVPALCDALGDRSAPVRKEAALALATLTGQDFGTDAAAWRAWWEARHPAPPNTPPPEPHPGAAKEVALLVEQLSSADPQERGPAAQALGAYGAAAAPATARLIELLGDESEFVVKRLPPQTPVRYRVSLAASRSLGQTGAPAVEALLAALKSPSAAVRKGAAYALGMIGDARTLGPLLAALKDPEPEVRSHVAWALGEFGKEKGVEPLLGLLGDGSDAVRESAARALKKVTGKDFGEDAAKWRAWLKSAPANPGQPERGNSDGR